MTKTANRRNVTNRKTASKFWENRKTTDRNPLTTPFYKVINKKNTLTILLTLTPEMLGEEIRIQLQEH